MLFRSVQKSVVVPAPAVMNGEQGPYIFVVSADQRADTRAVDVGRTVEDVVIVNKGITAGETVVTDGQLRLTPNARVDIKTPGENAASQDGNGQPAARQGRGGRGGNRRSAAGGEGGGKGGAPAPGGAAPAGESAGGTRRERAS